MERLEAHRAFFASLITAQAGVPSGRLHGGLCRHAARTLSWSRAVEDFYRRRIHHHADGRSGVSLPGRDGGAF